MRPPCACAPIPLVTAVTSEQRPAVVRRRDRAAARRPAHAGGRRPRAHRASPADGPAPAEGSPRGMRLESINERRCPLDAATRAPRIGASHELRLELVTVPVADVDRAKAFYVDQVGFSIEQDVQVDDEHRVVELMPPDRRTQSRSPQATSSPSRAHSRAFRSPSTTSATSTPCCSAAAYWSQRSRSIPGAASASSPIPTATAGRFTNHRARGQEPGSSRGARFRAGLAAARRSAWRART